MSDISILRLSNWIALDKSPEEIKRQERISELLSFISIPENPDVERFAHKNAIPYEKANKGRTYILVDENTYSLAYFTLGLGRLEYFADISGKLWKNSEELEAEMPQYLPAFSLDSLPAIMAYHMIHSRKAVSSMKC